MTPTCFWVLTLIVQVTLGANLTFPVSPDPNVYGHYTKSISLKWEFSQGVLLSASWSYVSPSLTIAEVLDENVIIKLEYKDRVNVSTTNTSVQINFYNLQYSDEGEIKCDVIQQDLTLFSGTTTLNVITPLNVSITPTQDSTINEYSSFTFDCVAQSRPISNITWYRDTTKVTSNSTTYSITETPTIAEVSTIESQLVIGNVSRHEAGQYRCLAAYSHSTMEKTARLIVQYKPENTSITLKTKYNYNLTDATLQGDDITMTCTSFGVPSVVYSIYNSTTLLSQSTTGILRLMNVTNSEEDIYRCETSNSAGDGMPAYKKLTIYAAPELISSSATAVALLGEQTEMYCEVKADPDPRIVWTFPDTNQIGRAYTQIETLKSNVNGMVVKRSTLTLHTTTKNDTGNYHCFINNTFGSINQSVYLILEHIPEIISFPPVEYATVEGATNVNIKCVVLSNPVSTIRWYINNVLYQHTSPDLYTITNKTTMDQTHKNHEAISTFHVNKVRKEDLANYTCEAVNEITGKGEQTSRKSTTLIISHNPYFLSKPPPEISVPNNTVAMLNCTVQGFPLPQVWWTTNNTNLDNTRVKNTTTVDVQTGKTIVNAVLEIVNVRASDYGAFTCYATDGNHTEMTHTVLKVSYAPKIIGPNPVTKAEEGQKISLECQAIAHPPPQITWYFAADGTSYENITNKAIVQYKAYNGYSRNVSSEITFGQNGVQRHDTGSYFCKVENTEGIKESRTNVTVQFTPEVAFTGQKQVNINETANFRCIVDGNPSPDVKWYKDGAEFQPFPRETPINNATLVRKDDSFMIQSAQPDDMGVYMCQATSIVMGTEKSVEETIDFKVLYAPILKHKSGSQKVSVQSYLELSCEADAYPPITKYVWFKNGVDMNIDQSKLIFSSVDLSVEAVYTCTPISNEIGPTIRYDITVKVEPVLKNSTCVTTKDGDALQCTCEGVGIPMPNVTWEELPSNKIISSRSILVIPLKNSTESVYACQLVNIHGNLTKLYNLSDFVSANSAWTDWSVCDTKCGNGQQNRTRKCHFKTCQQNLIETKSCNIPCPKASPIEDSWHKDWFIAFWVAIPLLVILVILCCVWCSKQRASEKKAVFVPINRELTAANGASSENGGIEPNGGVMKTMSTNRDIYLPDRVPMSALNNGYIPEQQEPKEIDESPKKIETDTIEVEMQFQEEDRPQSHQGSPPRRPRLNPVDAIVEVEDEGNGISNYDYDYDDEEEPDISFPASTFNHLGRPTANDAFMSLNDTNNGPPKPPRRQDSSFTGGEPGYGSASLF